MDQEFDKNPRQWALLKVVEPPRFVKLNLRLPPNRTEFT